MAGNEVRFAVGTRDDIRSSAWRLWARPDGRGNDLYLAGRSSGGIAKLSFHKSGINRFAPNSTDPRPAVFSWHRGTDISPGWSIAFSIVVTPPVTKHPLPDQVRNNKPGIFIIPPSVGTKAVFQIIRSPRTVHAEDVARLPATRKMTVHGNIRMERELAWLVSYYDDLSPLERAFIVESFNKVKITLGPGGKREGMKSAIAYVFGEEASRAHLVEIQLGQENIDVEPDAVA